LTGFDENKIMMQIFMN